MSTRFYLIFYQFYFFLEFIQISLSIGPSICILISSFKTDMIGLSCCELACYYKVYLFFGNLRDSLGMSLLCCTSSIQELKSS